MTQDDNARYRFLVETYETERLKVLGVWTAFEDADLRRRPHPTDRRGRSVLEHMVHQCLSENLWFRGMLGVDVGARPLPTTEARLEFIREYARDSAHRLEALRTGAPTLYAYADERALLEGEGLAGGRKSLLPGPGARPPTERPDPPEKS
jgi:hypothetical protein